MAKDIYKVSMLPEKDYARWCRYDDLSHTEMTVQYEAETQEEAEEKAKTDYPNYFVVSSYNYSAVRRMWG